MLEGNADAEADHAAENWASLEKVWKKNIIDLYHAWDDFDPAEFANPLLILPEEVLTNLRNYIREFPQDTEDRMANISAHKLMFAEFMEFCDECGFKYGEWGAAPAKQINAHCIFLRQVYKGAPKP